MSIPLAVSTPPALTGQVARARARAGRLRVPSLELACNVVRLHAVGARLCATLAALYPDDYVRLGAPRVLAGPALDELAVELLDLLRRGGAFPLWDQRSLDEQCGEAQTAAEVVYLRTLPAMNPCVYCPWPGEPLWSATTELGEPLVQPAQAVLLELLWRASATSRAEVRRVVPLLRHRAAPWVDALESEAASALLSLRERCDHLGWRLRARRGAQDHEGRSSSVAGLQSLADVLCDDAARASLPVLPIDLPAQARFLVRATGNPYFDESLDDTGEDGYFAGLGWCPEHVRLLAEQWREAQEFMDARAAEAPALTTPHNAPALLAALAAALDAADGPRASARPAPAESIGRRR